MLEELFSGKERIPWVEDALVQYFERPGAFLPGTLTDGSVSFISGDAKSLTLTPSGGVVCCSDAGLAERLVSEIESDRWEDGARCLADLAAIIKAVTPDASTNPCVMLYRRPSSGISIRGDIVPVTIEEAIPNRYPGGPEPEIVLGIRESSTILSHAVAYQPLTVADGRPFHELGVGTHPDYQRRGFARDMVSAALEYVASKNGVAVWNCRVTNEASLALARTLGFVEFSWTLFW